MTLTTFQANDRYLYNPLMNEDFVSDNQRQQKHNTYTYISWKKEKKNKLNTTHYLFIYLFIYVFIY